MRFSARGGWEKMGFPAFFQPTTQILYVRTLGHSQASYFKILSGLELLSSIYLL